MPISLDGAGDRGRTCKSLRTLAPKASASASSATPAIHQAIIRRAIHKRQKPRELTSRRGGAIGKAFFSL
jgi:hypothetical protein